MKLGEQVNISLKASDDISGIKYIRVWYKAPITGKSNLLSLTYNSTVDRYEGSIYIDNSMESGLWKINYINGIDNSNNEVFIYNSNINTYGEIRKDLSAGDFNVVGTSADIKAPDIDISSLKIDKAEVKLGEQVNISLKASDDISGIKYIRVWYKAPITGKSNLLSLTYNSTVDRYEGSIYIDNSMESGLWEISYINGVDNSNNEVFIYNSNINTYGNIREDLSEGDFNVVESNEDNSIKPIEGATVITKNETWSNKTVNGDLYIGPKAVLTVNSNVTITGNVYVLGALKIYGELTINGTLYGTNMSWGGNPILYNGTIVMNGTNSIPSMNMSNYPVQDIPVRIDTKPLVANNGKLNIKGATLDLADMYIEGKKIELGYQGSFDISDLYIGNKDSIDIEFITIFGNKIKKSIKLDDHINRVPTITANDITIIEGQAFNPLTGVTASDKEDGDLTPKVIVKENTVDTLKVGTYKIIYEVTDSDKNTVTKEIKVIVNELSNDVLYKTHVEEYGWQDWVSNGKLSGTSGQSKRLEAIEIQVKNNIYKGSIEYRTHVQEYGWQDWISNGGLSGTSGKTKRLEAIEIKLTGEMAEKYDVYYRVHAEDYGWLGWSKNGQSAGTEGLSKRLEAIEIKMVRKGDQAPGSTENSFIKQKPSVKYTTHVQNYGWQDSVSDGKMSGTSGEALRLEDIKIDLENKSYNGNIEYKTHIEEYGWQSWASNGKMSGTSGESKRLEAIEIRLTGEMEEKYDVYYRVHAQDYGWLGWAKNGQSAGTEGLSKRLESIEVLLVEKGAQAPGSILNSFIRR